MSDALAQIAFETDPPPVSVVIGSNRPTGLVSAVKSVLANPYPTFEVIVVMQGATPKTASQVLGTLADDPRVHCHYQAGRGAARARNGGLERASGELILITDDDCLVAPDWIERHVACYRERPAAGLVFGRVDAPAWYTASAGMVPTFSAAATHGTWRNRPGVVLGISANLSVRASTIQRIGAFDELLGPGAPLMCCEDMDLSLRASAAGILVLADDRPGVVHDGGVRPAGAESRLLWRRDGHGLGALLAKQLRTGNWFGAAAAGSIPGGAVRDAVLAILKRRHPFGVMLAANLTWGALGGLGRGLRQPLEGSGGQVYFTARR